jgi:hypothetical protein
MTATKPTIFEGGGIMHPCGHEASFSSSCIRMDRFSCPVCGLAWHMRTDPPIQHSSGWIEPGKRSLVIEPQMHLPI